VMTGTLRLGAGGCRRQVAFRRAAGRPGSGGARPCQLNLDTQEDAFTHTVLAAAILLMCSHEGCRISVENIASCTMGTGGPFPGGKARPGRDADHSPPSSAEV
jgi:hypothetical protein